MILRGWFFAAVLAAAILQFGCAGAMDSAKISRIVPGTTTVAEARRILGKPDSQLGSEGQVLLRYFTEQTTGMNPARGPVRYRGSSLDLLADSNGVIQKVHRYDSTTLVRPDRVDGRNTGPDLSADSLDRIKDGKTTAAQMSDLFGAPSEELLGFRGTMLRRWVQINYARGTVHGVITYLEVEFDDRDVVVGFTTEKGILF
jgi:hypothetical protein